MTVPWDDSVQAMSTEEIRAELLKWLPPDAHEMVEVLTDRAKRTEAACDVCYAAAKAEGRAEASGASSG